MHLPGVSARRVSARAGEYFIDAFKRRFVQGNFDCAKRALELIQRADADDRSRYGRISEQPCERYKILRLAKLIAERRVSIQLLAMLLEPLRIAAAAAAVLAAMVARKQAAVERTPWDNAKA